VTRVDSTLVELVWRRANALCEYCRIPQEFDAAPFQVEHIIARKHAGLTVAENLALSCLHCNLNKGSNIAGLDPTTAKLSRLFNPRLDHWQEHFAWRGEELLGLTVIGRITLAVLEINAAGRIQLRRSLIAEGLQFD
jgi:hypothetical protein